MEKEYDSYWEGVELMKIWQIVILMMIILRIMVFTFCYFSNLRKLNKQYSKYDIKYEWILTIIATTFLTDIFLFSYFFILNGKLTTKCIQIMFEVSEEIAHKICKKILKEDKK